MAIVMMTQEDEDALIAKVEREIPEGKTFAMVGFIDQKGIEAGLVVRRGALSAEAVFRHNWDGTNEGGAKLLAAW